MRSYQTERQLTLVYCEEPRDIPVLTVENYCKWYDLYLVLPDGVIQKVEFPDPPPPFKESPCMDHVPNPLAVKWLAESHGYLMDTQAYEMIVGRWEIESMNNYALVLEP